MANFKFRESNAEIQKRINNALAKEINQALKKAIPKIRSRMTPLIISALSSSPEISSLSSGVLRAEFGLTSDPSSELINAIVGTLEYRPLFAQANRGAGLQILMQPSDYSNLLTKGFAQQQIDGGSLPWLKWLLTLGDSIIITGFGVELGSFPNSRTGQARMTDKFAPYKVNSAFSGTVDNNFITRAIDKVYPQLTKVFRSAL
jgi:hypothetical protein